MKKLLIITFLLISIISTSLFAQKSKSAFRSIKTYDYTDQVTLGLGIVEGFFLPDEVNNYLSAYYGDYSFDYGFSDIVNHFDLSINLNYKLNNYFEFGCIGEADFGLKLITTNYGDKTWIYYRYIFGLLANAHLPLGSSEKNSIFFGLGPMYNMMQFEEFEGSTMGLRLQAGLNLNFGSFSPRVIIAYDIASADAKKVSGLDNPNIYQIKTLSYSSFLIGVNINFSLTGTAPRN